MDNRSRGAWAGGPPRVIAPFRLLGDDDAPPPRWLSLALFACLLVLGFRLASLPLYPLCDRTESRYAEIAREMEAGGDLVTPRLNGQPFWAKPPLTTWCEAGGIALFGPNEFGVRLPAWFAVLATLWVVLRIGRLLGGRHLGRVAFVVCCTAPLTLVMAGGVMTDPFLVLGTTLALYGVVRIGGVTREQWLAHGTPSGGQGALVLGLVIAALAKGPIGVIFGALPVAGLLLTRTGRERFVRFPFMPTLLGFVLLGVPWFVLAELRTPGFIEYFIVGEHVRRFLDPTWSGDLYGGTHPKPHGIVWLYFAVAILPWVPAAWRALRARGLRGVRSSVLGEPLVGVLSVSLLAPLVLFTLAGSLLPTYVYPSVPAASLLIAIALQPREAEDPVLRGSREHIPAWFALAGVPLLLVLVFLPEGLWASSSQRDVLAGVQAGHVVYARDTETLYSAAFYSGGRSVEAKAPDDPVWSLVRAEADDTVVVTRRRALERVPDDIRARLHLDRDVDGQYQVWHIDPVAPSGHPPSSSR